MSNNHTKTMKTLTIDDLKNRRSYIIAKIKRVRGESEVKRYMDLMLFQVECGFTGSVYDLFMETDFQLRPRAKKSGHKLAEIIGNNDNRAYSVMDKCFKKI